MRRLRSIRRRIDQHTANQLACSFILSRLDYCNAVLADLPSSTLAPLQRVLNSAARFVLNLRPNEHITAGLKALHWLPIKQRIQYKLCLLVHLALHNRSPPYITSLLTKLTDLPSRASLRSASLFKLDVPSTRLKQTERSFSVSSPRAWNLLPVDIRTIENALAFKKKLKTYLFNVAYN